MQQGLNVAVIGLLVLLMVLHIDQIDHLQTQITQLQTQRDADIEDIARELVKVGAK